MQSRKSRWSLMTVSMREELEEMISHKVPARKDQILG